MQMNGIYLVIISACVLMIAYRFYGAFMATRVLSLNTNRVTPAVRINDGGDYVPTNKWVNFGQHFAAIAGAGPLVGPVIAAQFGYLPGALWILIGCVLAGAVHDFVLLFASVRHDGKSSWHGNNDFHFGFAHYHHGRYGCCSSKLLGKLSLGLLHSFHDYSYRDFRRSLPSLYPSRCYD